MSEAEADLGLGTIVEVDHRSISVFFHGSDTLRSYAKSTAPLKRVNFGPGDRITAHDGSTIVIERVKEQDGLLLYVGANTTIPESELSDYLSFSKADERLFSSNFDSNSMYQLRSETLAHKADIPGSAVRGLVGGRLDLIPHQLYIAKEVASRYSPRVLLADEVGLGKTIEAGLILHQLLVSGRAERALIVVPDSLVHQWFVEMYRRFNLSFAIFNEERFDDSDDEDTEWSDQSNPFFTEQLVLCSIEFLTKNQTRPALAMAAGWDVLVVDEAHHLEWSPSEPSFEYAVIEHLAEQSKSLLLLTATPEQLGVEGHFARLRLLDPARFPDLEEYIEETTHYEALAQAVEPLISDNDIDGKQLDVINRFLDDADRHYSVDELKQTASRQALLDELLDRHGTGRVLLRNTRAAMQGFPQRLVHRHSLDRCVKYLDNMRQFVGNPSLLDAVPSLLHPPELFHRFIGRINDDDSTTEWWQFDPRIDWLINFVGEKAPAKILLICASKSTVLALDEALRKKSGIKFALFHEGLSLVNRDRAAAWFAEDDGAQLLICSEIGSEGRNFQFSHHLILFDLPANPDVLEQRIGRLDRIGQKHDINIHVPVIEGDVADLLFRWYQHGLNAFETHARAAGAVYSQLSAELHQCALAWLNAELSGEPPAKCPAFVQLLEHADRLNTQLSDELEHGRDRLLELHSYNEAVARDIVQLIDAQDHDPKLRHFMEQTFDAFGVDCQEHSRGAWVIKPTEHVLTEAFPTLTEEGLTITYDRQIASSREDMTFLTWDHPMVTSLTDLLLGSEYGNATVIRTAASGSKKGYWYLEATYLLECVAPNELEADRFFPPTAVRIVVNHELNVIDKTFSQATDIGQKSFETQLARARPLMRKMMDTAAAKVDEKAAELTALAIANMHPILDQEAERLIALKAKNPNIRDDEIQFAEQRVSELEAHIAAVTPRLDAVRLIIEPPSQ